jgi:hypothetical protein
LIQKTSFFLRQSSNSPIDARFEAEFQLVHAKVSVDTIVQWTGENASGLIGNVN